MTISPASDPASRPTRRALRLLDLIRWLLPLVLGAIAITFEWTEHLTTESEDLSFGFWGEVLLFGLVGPVAVAATLSWVRRLVVAFQATSDALEDINSGLESMVQERTSSLQAAGEALARGNQELARANDELRQLDRLKSEFVSLVSHQLRAPLTNIIGALEIVSGDAELLPPSSRRTLRILGGESERLSHLIETILDVSRLEAGRLTLRPGPVAMEPLLARVCASVLADTRRPWSLDVQPGLPPAWGDEPLLEEVVRNLVDNAARYSPAGLPVEIAARRDDGVVVVSVADHGPGIPAEQRASIFRSFHRLDQSESAVAGYGLGLYFAEKLVRVHGGRIWVEGNATADPDPPGARFAFTIPIAEEVPSDEDDPTTGGVPTGDAGAGAT